MLQQRRKKERDRGSGDCAFLETKAAFTTTAWITPSLLLLDVVE
jgi:hypothetical protein